MRLVDVSKGRPANTDADRRRGPKWTEGRRRLVAWFFEAVRKQPADNGGEDGCE